MLPSSIRAVAFDAVGTLIHPEPAAAEVYAAAGRQFGSRLGIDEIRRRFRAAFAEQERRDVENGFVVSEARELERWQTIVADVLCDVADLPACFAHLYQHFARPDAWRCEAGTAELLCSVRDSGYVLAMASNYDQRLASVVAGRDALVAIGTVVISSAVGWRKPAREFFAHLAGALGVRPEEVLYVGDDFSNDFVGARHAGMQALLFDPLGRRPELRAQRLGKLADLSLPGVSKRI